MFEIYFNGEKVTVEKCFLSLCERVKELIYGVDRQRFAITVIDTLNEYPSFTITSFRGNLLFVDNLTGVTATFYEDDKWYFWDENGDLIISESRFDDCLFRIMKF